MIKTVTVIGANGTMGCNVSGIFASFGNAKVYMVCRSLEEANKAADKAAKSVKADVIRNHLIPSDYSKLENCIRDSHLIFESVTEDIDIKQNVYKKITPYIKSDTILATGTSGLSINQLAKAFPEYLQKNFVGLHFFNPPYSMTLCEVIPSDDTDRRLLDEVKSYLADRLIRKVVEVKDAPAFLGNRIGFQFINEILQNAVTYKEKGGIDYMDAVLGKFTGRSMAPLVTSDFVGLDVHKAIVDNVYKNTNDYAKDTFLLPSFTVDLITAGQMGRKTNGGLYRQEKLENGVKRVLVYDIDSNQYREKVHYQFPYAEKMIAAIAVGNYEKVFRILISDSSDEANLCLKFMLKYVIYSLNAAELIGYDLHAADDVMAAGFNWCPPLAVIQSLFGVKNFSKLVKERLDRTMQKEIDLDRLLFSVEDSRYDYRRFFLAKH